MDKGANRVAFDRMNDALIRFHSSENDYATPLRDLLIGLVHDPAHSASTPPEISGKKSKKSIDIDELPLNDSQKLAVLNSIDRKISLIQEAARYRKNAYINSTFEGDFSNGKGAYSAPAPQMWQLITCLRD